MLFMWPEKKRRYVKTLKCIYSLNDRIKKYHDKWMAHVPSTLQPLKIPHCYYTPKWKWNIGCSLKRWIKQDTVKMEETRITLSEQTELQCFALLESVNLCLKFNRRLYLIYLLYRSLKYFRIWFLRPLARCSFLCGVKETETL